MMTVASVQGAKPVTPKDEGSVQHSCCSPLKIMFLDYYVSYMLVLLLC